MRSGHDRQLIADLAISLTQQFGKGWTHFNALIYIEDPLKRDFFITMAIQERSSTRTLDERIGSLLFERTAI